MARPARLADRLADAASSACMGRLVELDRLRALLTDGAGPAVVFLHGPAGIGKTVMLTSALDLLDAPTVMIDGRHVEPTPAGVLAALGASMGHTEMRDVEDVAAALETGRVAVVAIDGYEHLGIVDGWVRNELLPALPAATRFVLAGRSGPNVAWRTAPGWRQLIGEQLLGPLTEADAEVLLARRGLPSDVAARALRFARGHPLALVLAAEAFARRPDAALPDGPPPEVVEELVDIVFDGLPDADRRIVESVSVLRRVTEPLLQAVLADDGERGGALPDAPAAWRALRALPFTTVTSHGLELHPVLRDVVASALELRNPERARRLRRAAGQAALAETQRSPGWESTADLLHLVQHPVVRSAFVPPAGFQHPVERARPEDREAVLDIVARHHGDRSAAVLAAWWDGHADGFVVARGARGEVSAFSLVVEVDRIDDALWRSDPVLPVVRDDLRRRPLPAGGRCLLNRLALSARRGAELSTELAPMLVDIKRSYLELRPDLARVYVVTSNWAGSRAMMSGLGFSLVGSPIDDGVVQAQVCALDFGPGSVDAWLARQVEAGSPPPPDSGPPDDRIDEPTASGDAVARLSPREREVLAALAEGLTNQELAERLFISERTANRHVSNIFTKLGVHNRTAAARVAIQAGLAG